MADARHGDGFSPLHAQDPTGRFSARAGDYARHRPSYPPEVLDFLLPGPHALPDRGAWAGTGPIVAPDVPRGLDIADVGAGTGIFAARLAARGHRVVAIEPNAAMRAAAEPDPRITWIDATAEATTLAAASVDLVTCAQAFHWFRPTDAAREFARILRPGGRLALIWNVRDERDAFTAAYSRVMDEASGGRSMDRGEFDRDGIGALGLFTPWRLKEFAYRQLLDRRGLVGRALSASYFPERGDAADRLLADLGRAFEAHQEHGAVALVYVTRVWVAERT